MLKKVSIVGVPVVIIIVLALSIDYQLNSDITGQEPESEDVFQTEQEKEPKTTPRTELQDEPDVIMPTKVSRPGCEQEDRCYVPSIITIKKGENVIWQNRDSAFHSVTSGSYESPTALFDSGHLDPYQFFTLVFDEPGVYDYFCTLHPWMVGQVIVE